MPSSDSNSTKPSSVAGRSNKSSKRSMTIVLKLPSTRLDRFPGISVPEVATEDVKSKDPSSPSPTSTPLVVQPSSADNASDTASTPAASADTPAAKGLAGPKPGSKRAAPGTDTTPKPRGKPGPKKRSKLEDGTGEGTSRPSGSGHGGSHRLGPKANQGAINAGLRALDRTGKPCRKWERKSFQVKSFTGVSWGAPSWRAPPKPKPTEESSDNTKEEVAPSAQDADSKVNGTSTAQSEKSNSGEGAATPFPSMAESSPTPFVPVAS